MGFRLQGFRVDHVGLVYRSGSEEEQGQRWTLGWDQSDDMRQGFSLQTLESHVSRPCPALVSVLKDGGRIPFWWLISSEKSCQDYLDFHRAARKTLLEQATLGAGGPPTPPRCTRGIFYETVLCARANASAADLPLLGYGLLWWPRPGGLAQLGKGTAER